MECGSKVRWYDGFIEVHSINYHNCSNFAYDYTSTFSLKILSISALCAVRIVWRGGLRFRCCGCCCIGDRLMQIYAESVYCDLTTSCDCGVMGKVCVCVVGWDR